MMIKRIIKSGLKRFGIVAFKNSSRAYVPESETYKVVAELVGKPDPVVIDGGAHLGDMVEKFGAHLPQAEFHCFEPDPELGEILSHKYSVNPRVNVVQAALGERPGKVKFNMNASRPTNSLLDAAEDLQSDLMRLCDPVKQVEVAVTTIDEYSQKKAINRVDLIKLDLQGYDYLALQGARSTLVNVKIVLVEILFAKIYQGGGTFQDILDLMRECGFELHTLCGLQYGDKSKLLWADAVFIKLT